MTEVSHQYKQTKKNSPLSGCIISLLLAAIFGIILAIAIPALASKRAQIKDMSATNKTPTKSELNIINSTFNPGVFIEEYNNQVDITIEANKSNQALVQALQKMKIIKYERGLPMLEKESKSEIYEMQIQGSRDIKIYCFRNSSTHLFESISINSLGPGLLALQIFISHSLFILGIGLEECDKAANIALTRFDQAIQQARQGAISAAQIRSEYKVGNMTIKIDAMTCSITI